MSAQPVPIKTPKSQPFLPLDHKLLECLWPICRGGAMFTLLTYILSAANRRAKDGTFTGWTGPIRTQTFAEAGCCVRHAINQQIRIALKEGAELIERMDTDAAVKAGLITKEEADNAWDGYVYRALVENWPSAAAIERQRWEDAKAFEGSEEEKPEPKPDDSVVPLTADPVTVEPGHTAPVELCEKGRAALGSCVAMQFRSDLQEAFTLRSVVQSGVLTLEASRTKSEAGNLSYRPTNPLQMESVIRDLRKLLKPIFIRLFSAAPDEKLISMIADALGECPVYSEPGLVSYKRAVDSKVAAGGDIRRGLFVNIARDARAAWLERKEDEASGGAPPAKEESYAERRYREIVERRAKGGENG